MMLGLCLFLFISILAHWFLIPRKWRSLFLFFISFFIIAYYHLIYACYFLLNIILVYAVGILIRKEAANKKLILQLILVWLVGSLCFFKYPFGEGHTHSQILWPLGLSYITFRLIHYIVEVYRKNTPEGFFVDVALYVLFFPTFLAGPVDRFQRFQPQIVGIQGILIADVNYGLYRIVCGLIKKFFIADYLMKYIMPVLSSPEIYSRLVVIGAVYGLAIQIYMDFSGYTDMAIGIARLFGYTIMENFDRPFFKKNIALFWRSWHISVYGWVRDYFFFPFFGHKPSSMKIYAGIFCSMLVFNLWHRFSLPFLILGIYHGAGLVVWYFFQEIKKKYPPMARLIAHRFLDPVATFLTFSFVSLGSILLGLDMANAFAVLQRVF